MNRFALVTLRLLLPAWIGAALLFVATSVAEQVHEGFAPLTKDTLAAIRFPIYYGSGLVVLSACAAASLVLWFYSDNPTRSRKLLPVLTLTVLGMMLADRFFIFEPLQQLMTDGETTRTDRFRTLHQMSKYVNFAELLLLMPAAWFTTRDR